MTLERLDFYDELKAAAISETAQGEIKKLADRLYNTPGKTTHNFHVSPGEAYWRGEVTNEQLAAEVNKGFDQVENGTATVVDSFDDSDTPPTDVKDWLRERDRPPR